MRPLFKSLLFPAISLTAGLLLCELALQLFAWAAPRHYARLAWTVACPVIVDDARLGVRPNPLFPEHDRNGFRNRSVPRAVSVVALGDSQTYGAGVLPDQPWPQQLEKLDRQDGSVYNMACGGWGPTHSLLLFDEALALKPKLIIEAFYSGNDLYDSYAHVYNRHQLPELRSHDGTSIRSMEAADRKQPLEEAVQNLFFMNQNVAQGRLKSFMRGHCRIYQLVARVREISRERRNRSWEVARQDAAQNAAYCQPFESGGVKTVFTPQYRASVLDLRDPRIAEGLRISLEAIRRMNDRARAARIRFLVLLIPTKELVFKEAVYRHPVTVPKPYQTLIEEEERVRQQVTASLSHEGIEFADALPGLRESVRMGDSPYPITSDGHPNGAGHCAMAETVLSAIREHRLLAMR